MRPDTLDRPARILIVDDELPNGRVLEAMLAPAGYVLVTVDSGDAALALVASEPPDLVLLDIRMPGTDGYEVARRLKADPATRSIPIIMCTALEDRESRMLGLGAGAEDVLTKPFDQAELRMRVRNLLRLKAYADYVDQYSQRLECEVRARTADLRQERDRGQRYLDTAETILLALDLDGRTTLVNRHACGVLGWGCDELIGRDFIETCVPGPSQPLARETFRTVLAGDQLLVVENTIRTKSGGERLIEWRSTLLKDGDGCVTGTFSCGTDVTERHRAIHALRSAEERMRFALSAADIGIWDIDYATGVLRWSETLEGHYGLRPGTFGGTFQAFIDRVHPDDQASVRTTIGAAMAAGTEFSIDHRAMWPDGTVRWLRGTGRTLLDEHGEPLRGVGISMDVTERRALEIQHQQSQKMEAIGRLAAGVAHDFNNLLTVILGFSEILAADGSIQGRHRADVGEIAKAAQRASGLTKQLLAFSRQQVLKTSVLDVNGLITDMTSMLGRLIGADVDIVLKLDPASLPVLADRSQLEQVVMNLVVNARDAMAAGGRLTIETTSVELDHSDLHDEAAAPGRYVMLSVTDTGAGMSSTTQKRIFEPFFTTKVKGEGTGLGLSTVYGVIKQSRGYILVDSEPGAGTTFKVYLPQATSPAAADAPRPIRAASPAKKARDTVLLVEDESGVRRLSRRILDDAGYRVIEAATGDDAEELFASHEGSIDLVLTDVVMPGCGGPELLERLRLRAPDVRVLYMSGYTEQSAANRLGIGSGQPFVQKPFTASELVRHVREALDVPR